VVPVCALAAAPAAPGGPAGRGAAVPAGFQPAAASFRSPASGVVLGGVACKGLVRGVWSRCAARLVATADGGVRWHFLTAPGARLVRLLSTSRGAAVSSVVFASRRNGWLYGPGLWSTHDGGAHWRRVSLGKAIVAMAAASGTVYAVARPAGYLSSGGPSELFASPAGQDAWAPVRSVPVSRAPASLAVSGRAAWFASSTHLRATADGVHWHRYPFRCPVTHDLANITAASRTHVLFLCTGNGAAGSSDKVVLSSASGGRAVHLAGRAPSGGSGAIIAVPPHRAKVITLAAESGASFLDRSADGGRTWTQMTVPGSAGGPLLSSLSYVSRKTGWAVLGEPGQGSQNRLLRTSDAGRTWHQASF
jgi:photosystem II stability/assembly factor-like uncharacterized protein